MFDAWSNPGCGRGPHDQIHRRLCDVFPIRRMPFAFRTPCANGWEVRLTLERPRQARRIGGSRNDMPPNTAGSAQRRSTFWGHALLTRNLKGNFRMECAPRNLAYGASHVVAGPLRRIRHLSVREQVNTLNGAEGPLRYYYGIAGTFVPCKRSIGR